MDKKPAYKTRAWFNALKSVCLPGEKAEFLLATSLNDVNVFYELQFEDSLIHRKWLKLNDEQKLFSIDIKEEYRGSLKVSFVFVKDNRYYNYSQQITVPFENKKLDIEFMTFRNKLYPGEKEEWRLKIKGSEGEKAVAEMLAGLYDASLDELKEHNWYFNLYRKQYYYNYWAAGNSGTSVSRNLDLEYNDYYSMPYKSTQHLTGLDIATGKKAL